MLNFGLIAKKIVKNVKIRLVMTDLLFLRAVKMLQICEDEMKRQRTDNMKVWRLRINV